MLCFLGSIALSAQQPKQQPKQQPAKPAVKAQTNQRANTQPNTPKKMNPTKDDTLRLEGGVKVIFRKKGNGVKPQIGQTITAHYTGTLPNGKKFDSSKDRNQPFSFELVTGGVIQGWHIGFAALGIGDQALLIIPADKAYGDREFKDEATGEIKIPKRSTLHFEVELLDIDTPADFVPYSEEGKEIFTTPTGLRYYYVQKNNARFPVMGQKLTFHFNARMKHGYVLEDSRNFGQSMSLILGSGKMMPIFEEGLQILRVGEKAVFLAPPERAFGNRQVGPVPPNSPMVFELELLDAKEAPKPIPFNTEGKDTITLPNGLKMIFVESGNNDTVPVTPKSTAVVHYTGYFLDGRIFDSSIERDEPLPVTIGANAVILGWEEALIRMKKFDKCRVIIPPGLGYGTQDITNPTTGKVEIPANSTLIFDMEVVDVKN